MDDTVVRRVLVRELMTYSGCHFLSTLSLDLTYLLKVLSHYCPIILSSMVFCGPQKAALNRKAEECNLQDNRCDGEELP